MIKYKVTKNIYKDFENRFGYDRLKITHEYYIQEIAETLAHRSYVLQVDWDSHVKRVWVFAQSTFLQTYGGLEEISEYVRGKFEGKMGLHLNIDEKKFNILSQLIFEDVLEYLQIDIMEVEIEEIKKYGN